MTTYTGGNHWRPGCACCAGATLATRRGFLAGTAALGAASGSGFLASLTGASAQGAVAPRGNEFVIRGGYVITMDKAAGDRMTARRRGQRICEATDALGHVAFGHRNLVRIIAITHGRSHFALSPAHTRTLTPGFVYENK